MTAAVFFISIFWLEYSNFEYQGHLQRTVLISVYEVQSSSSFSALCLLISKARCNASFLSFGTSLKQCFSKTSLPNGVKSTNSFIQQYLYLYNAKIY
ncbi:hypothetical protein FGO68_gene10227 [Halteria grandinella]|uniref:Uncharacterized protein n=1 Tax=Halteria grandinella TaxID=5974 RepID=A0A8J8NP09_HALGN|nr:hypothetical protein FGO68_gene10227 [Halteria grandinella]